MPTIVVPSMTITIAATRTATSIDVSGLIVCDAPVDGNPNGPARMDFFVGGQYVGNTYGGPVESQPYHRQYTFSAPLASILDADVADEVTFTLYTAAGQQRARAVLSIVPPVSGPVPQLVPGKIIRTLFWNDQQELAAEPATVAAFHAANVNALTLSIFRNPADNPTVTTLEEWRVYSLTAPSDGLLTKLAWCQANGFLVAGVGDDICRTQAERDWLANTPWAEQAIRETVAVLRDSGICPYVAMVDEMGGVPADYPVVADLMAWWRAENGPAVGFPFQRQPGDPFEALPYSDVNDRFWSRGVKGGGPDMADTLWQSLDGIQRASTGQPVVGRPFLCQISAMGAHYTKLVNGGEYHPGQDLLQDGGIVTPSHITAQVKAALAYGACGVRVYAYDFAVNRNNRLLAGIGQGGCETGIQIGTPKWDALSEAFGWVAANEAALCGPYLPPVVSGGVIVGRRAGLTWTVPVTE